eukprot:gene3911-4274_t
MEISLLLPPSDGPVDFDSLNCTVMGNDVHLVPDSELHLTNPAQVLEVNGLETSITFYPDCSRQYIAFYIKAKKRYLSFQLICLDEKQEHKVFQVSNKFSFITIDDNICKLPLDVGHGWQYICLDLEDLMANVFGSVYSRCLEVQVSGSCRLSKIYFQSHRYADIELPDYLRVVNA